MVGNNGYALSRSELIELAGFKGSAATVARYVQLDVINARRDRRGGYRYNQESVERLRLIPELKKYSLDQREMRDTFKSVPMERLKQKVGAVPPDALYEFLEKHGVKLDRDWLYEAAF